MAIILRLPSGELDKILPEPRQGSYIWMAFYGHAGEFKEYCFALAMLLYILSIYLRMGNRSVALATAAEVAPQAAPSAVEAATVKSK